MKALSSGASCWCCKFRAMWYFCSQGSFHHSVAKNVVENDMNVGHPPWFLSHKYWGNSSIEHWYETRTNKSPHAVPHQIHHPFLCAIVLILWVTKPTCLLVMFCGIQSSVYYTARDVPYSVFKRQTLGGGDLYVMRTPQISWSLVR